MKKILVAEDDKYLASAYQTKLTKSDYEVKIASNGEEALHTLKSFIPDIILLDLVMPKKDGFTTLEEIKKTENLKHIPVIVATNLGQQEDIGRAKQLGAADYVVKSNMSLDEIIAKIEATIK